jgi:hypothetical protein
LNNKKENNAFVKSFSGDLVEIFRLAMDKAWLPKGSTDIFDIQVDSFGAKYVRSRLYGDCKFRMGIEQHVTINEEPLLDI